MVIAREPRSRLPLHLGDWREIYWEYIERECQRIGLEPNTKAPLVMERFGVVYAEPLRMGGDL